MASGSLFVKEVLMKNRPNPMGIHAPAGALRRLLLCALLLIVPWTPVVADTTISSNITTDTTWTLAGSPYIVTGYITVQGATSAGATLTIEPGVQVRFNSGRYLNIGASSGNPGALIAQGTAAAPIIFTSNQATPSAGYWNTIRFYNTADDAASTLEHCAIQYAVNGVNIQQASPTIRNTTISNSSSYGINIANGAPTIDSCQFSANGNYDLWYSGTIGGSLTGSSITKGIYLLATGAVAFSGNAIQQNNSYPIKAYADNVGAVVNGCTINNVDGASYLEVSGNTITKDATWTAAIPYLISGYPTVQGATSAGATLTIAPGVQVRFNSGRYLNIGASSGNPGALIAQGTAEAPIVFTSNQTAPTAGYWNTIRFYNTADDATSILEHCTIQYAVNGVNIQQASPTIRNTAIRDTSSYGINISTGAPTIEGCQFSANGNYDLWYSGTIGGSLTGSSITRGIYLLATGAVAFSGNTIQQNNSYPIKAYADNVGPIVNGCTFSDVNSTSYLEVSGNTITKDATWTAAIPYVISGYLTVQGVDGEDATTTLTIAPGATLKFNQGRYLNIGASSGNPGALIAQGTSATPILFTSNQATPTAGYWNNIKIDNTANDITTVLSNCVLEYGGGSNQGLLNLTNAKPTIAYSTFRYSSHAGIYINGSGSTGATINCDTFTSNLYGLDISSALPLIQQNNFNANTNYGIYYSGAGTLAAENNWWGAAAGPNTTGDRTYGNVDADPWAASETQCVVAGENHPPFEPNNPTPTIGQVRVQMSGGIALQWSGGDPDTLDTVVYDLYWGASASTMALRAQNITTPNYLVTDANAGLTYYWSVVARDNRGMQTSGPVWHFTADGPPPDLIVSGLTVNPAGHLQSGQSITLTARIDNVGSGPVVDRFDASFKINGATVGTVAVNEIILAGNGLQAVQTWTYTAGDPTIEIMADSMSGVSETNEGNNRYITKISEVADNTSPNLVAHSPSNGASLKQILQITVSLADSQSDVADAAVIASFALRNANQQSIAGSISENNNTFTFVPASLPLPDGTYQVSLTASDTLGNTQAYSFDFTIDAQPPNKPTVTGGTVQSGTIQARPALNTAADFMAPLQGTRDPETSVWINGARRIALGSGAWSIDLTLAQGGNVLEIWCVDAAGNRGPSEWVDIDVTPSAGLHFDYNDAGRMKRVRRIDQAE
jgi:hypothetical protein